MCNIKSIAGCISSKILSSWLGCVTLLIRLWRTQWESVFSSVCAVWISQHNSTQPNFLPPASEGWGKVIFSVCPHLRGGGYPISGLGRGVPHPRSGWWGGGVPHLRSGWWGGGVPHSRSQWLGGGTPSQVWMVGRGVPHPRSGWWGGGGYPIQGLDGGGGYLEYPPPIRQSSIANTCYAASGVPLAFTQEDLLVSISLSVSLSGSVSTP